MFALGVDSIVVATGNITATGNARVNSYGDVDATVTAGGGVYLTSGGSVKQDTTGGMEVVVLARGGSVDKPVVSGNRSVMVGATGNIEDTVSAQQHVYAASLANINGTVTAANGHASVLALGGEVKETVTAGLSGQIFALNDVKEDVTTGTVASVRSFADLRGDVNAGTDAIVSLGGGAYGETTAARHAILSAAGNIPGNVTATGSALVTSLGNVTASISAGEDALVFVHGAIDSTVNAGQDLFVQSYGNSKNIFTAGRDALVWTAGDLQGVATAGRDLATIAVGQHQVSATAGGDSFGFGGGYSDIAVSAGGDAYFITLDSVSGGLVNAADDAAVWALGSILGPTQVYAGGYAGATTWGSAGPANILYVSGTDGAYGWTYGTVGGTVTSSNGDAVLTTLGDAWTTAVTAGSNAGFYSVGEAQLMTVTGGQFAGAVSLGGFDGSVTAGADATVLSEGAVNAILTAGKDGFVHAYGDITGGYSAGRDVAAVSYSSVDAGIFGGRDVGYVLAGGDIRGAIIANRRVGQYHDFHDDFTHAGADPVFSYGSIDATIGALGTVGSTNTGEFDIGVGAVGNVDGSIIAGTSIGHVRSGNAVTATVTSPSPGTVIEYDASLASAVAPTAPASIAPGILADAALGLAGLQTEAAAFFTSVGELLDVADQARFDTLASLAESQARHLAAIGDTLAEVTALVERGRYAARSAFEAEVLSEQFALDRLARLVEQTMNSHEGAFNATRKSSTAAYDRAVTAAELANEKLDSLQSNLESAKFNAQTSAWGQKSEWEESFKTLQEKLIEGIGNLILGLEAAAESLWETIWNLPEIIDQHMFEQGYTSIYHYIAGNIINFFVSQEVLVSRDNSDLLVATNAASRLYGMFNPVASGVAFASSLALGDTDGAHYDLLGMRLPWCRLGKVGLAIHTYLRSKVASDALGGLSGSVTDMFTNGISFSNVTGALWSLIGLKSALNARAGCFVADVGVHGMRLSAATDEEGADEASNYYAEIALGLVIAGVVGARVLRQLEEKKRRQQKSADEAFANDGFDELWGDNPLPELDAEQMDELCDTLCNSK